MIPYFATSRTGKIVIIHDPGRLTAAYGGEKRGGLGKTGSVAIKKQTGSLPLSADRLRREWYPMYYLGCTDYTY
jgi:hypothetical protein